MNRNDLNTLKDKFIELSRVLNSAGTQEKARRSLLGLGYGARLLEGCDPAEFIKDSLRELALEYSKLEDMEFDEAFEYLSFLCR